MNEPISFHYARSCRPGKLLVVEDDLIACEDGLEGKAALWSGDLVIDWWENMGSRHCSGLYLLVKRGRKSTV